MKKLFEIIIENSVDISFFNVKINELGNAYRLYQDKYFLYADFDSAQKLYDTIVTNDYRQIGIVVLEIPLKGFSFWGYSEKSFWAWLDLITTEAIRDNNTDNIEHDLLYQIQTLKKENEELKRKLANYENQ